MSEERYARMWKFLYPLFLDIRPAAVGKRNRGPRTMRVVLEHLWYHCRLYPMCLFPSPHVKRNRVLRNIHRGKRCFILGSGPSIEKKDLTHLENEIVITQNNFHAHDQIDLIKPNYHVVVPKYQSAEHDDDWVEWLQAMNERLPKSAAYFFNENTKYLVDRLSLFEDRVYYLRQGYNCALVRRAPVNLTRGLMAVPTVLPMCLAIAIYLGFSDIYLMGYDLDTVCRWHKPDRKRFYGKSPVTRNEAERDLEERSQSLGLKWINMWMIWRQCNLLKVQAERRGIRIINSTRGGLLDMFERIDYENIAIPVR